MMEKREQVGWFCTRYRNNRNLGTKFCACMDEMVKESEYAEHRARYWLPTTVVRRVSMESANRG